MEIVKSNYLHRQISPTQYNSKAESSVIFYSIIFRRNFLAFRLRKKN